MLSVLSEIKEHFSVTLRVLSVLEHLDQGGSTAWVTRGRGLGPQCADILGAESLKIEDTAVKEAIDRWSRKRVVPGHPASHWALFTPILRGLTTGRAVEARECPVATPRLLSEN